VSVYQIVRPLSQHPSTEEPPAKTRVQQRCDEDYRYCMADGDLSRAKRQINEARKMEDRGGYRVARSMRVDASYLFERHLEFLIIDPEAKL
jgi:hypothetical protein